MEMEAISRRTDVEEPELVALIQEGLSKGKFNDILFAAVRSMKEIKYAVNVYEQREAIRGQQQVTILNPTKTTPNLRAAPNLGVVRPTEDRCYNCSRTGHMRPACPYEDRPRRLLPVLDVRS